MLLSKWGCRHSPTICVCVSSPLQKRCYVDWKCWCGKLSCRAFQPWVVIHVTFVWDSQEVVQHGSSGPAAARLLCRAGAVSYFVPHPISALRCCWPNPKGNDTFFFSEISSERKPAGLGGCPANNCTLTIAAEGWWVLLAQLGWLKKHSTALLLLR